MEKYIVMINTWNGQRGIASDDYTGAYSGVEHDSEEAAKTELLEARKATRNNLLVNYCYIEKR